MSFNCWRHPPWVPFHLYWADPLTFKQQDELCGRLNKEDTINIHCGDVCLYSETEELKEQTCLKKSRSR